MLGCLTVKDLVQVSRPGWWLVTVWLYIAPTGQRWDLLTSSTFWLGLLYVCFPINLMVYGINDYADFFHGDDLDGQNDRKGNFFFG